jgi:hypothetical protein
VPVVLPADGALMATDGAVVSVVRFRPLPAAKVGPQTTTAKGTATDKAVRARRGVRTGLLQRSTTLTPSTERSSV